MVVIPPYQTAVSLFSSEGQSWHFASKKAAVTALGRRWITNNVGAYFREFSHNAVYHPAGHEATIGWRLKGNPTYTEPVYRTAQFILRDDAGQSLLAHDFPEPVRKPKRNIYRWRDEAWNGEGPVPGISKRRGGHHYYRRIRHVGMFRDAQYFPEEGEVAQRRGRNAIFGDPWHEFGIASRKNRNWKEYRKKQYKAKA